MKKIIIILFLAALPAVTVFSESNPHDSLLFDGENLCGLKHITANPPKNASTE